MRQPLEVCCPSSAGPTLSIPGAAFALSLPPALFSSSRVKSSSRRTTQELRSCIWNGSTCGNKLRTMYLTVLPPVHRTFGLPALTARHRVVASRDHLLPRRARSSFKRPSRADLTKLINEPGFFEVFAKSFPAETSRVSGGAPSFAAPTLIHRLTPLF